MAGVDQLLPKLADGLDPFYSTDGLPYAVLKPDAGATTPRLLSISRDKGASTSGSCGPSSSDAR